MKTIIHSLSKKSKMSLCAAFPFYMFLLILSSRYYKFCDFLKRIDTTSVEVGPSLVMHGVCKGVLCDGAGFVGAKCGCFDAGQGTSHAMKAHV